MTFEQLDRSIDADSDSDDEIAHQAHIYRCNLLPSYLLTPVSNHFSQDTKSCIAVTEKNKESEAAHQLAGLKISGNSSPTPEARPVKPPRPMQPPPISAEEEEDDDEDNPFADSNAVVTPAQEKPEPRW